MNKKGFTLVELLSTLIVLIIVLTLALVKVRSTMVSSKKKALKASAISFVKATDNLVSVTNGDPNLSFLEGFYDVDSLYDLGVSLSGKKPSGGYAYITNNKIHRACLELNGYRINYIDGNYKDAIDGKCPLADEYNKFLKMYFYNYSYSGKEDSVILDEPGTYVIEAWGASGGNNNKGYKGGTGGYARTSFELLDGESITLYINVGGEGSTGAYGAATNGGYNGGGKIYVINSCSNSYGSGGGATSIATASGLLSTLSNNKDKIILVAAGGGGAAYRYCSDTDYVYGNGGNAGGFTGAAPTIDTCWTSNSPSGGTQVSPGIGGTANNEGSTQNGQFGVGGSYTRTSSNVGQAGGGGGLYGGGLGMFVPGAGGSSYFAPSFMVSSRTVNTENGSLICNDCLINPSNLYKTKSVTTSSSLPITNVPKIGNGYVRITRTTN